jgi:hypothetical protein
LPAFSFFAAGPSSKRTAGGLKINQNLSFR